MATLLLVALAAAVVGVLGSFGLYAIVRSLAGLPAPEKGEVDDE
jgi:hypothetical protein